MTTHNSLDFNIIERASEKYENLKEIIVQLEIDERVEFFTVEIYKYFSTVQMTKCIQELIEKLDYVRVKNSGDISGIIIPYTMFLIIKHFTTLELPNKFAEQLKAIEHMTNTGTMFQIFVAFDDDEIGKIQSEIIRVLDIFEKNMEGIEELKEQLREKLVDKSLLD